MDLPFGIIHTGHKPCKTYCRWFFFSLSKYCWSNAWTLWISKYYCHPQISEILAYWKEKSTKSHDKTFCLLNELRHVWPITGFWKLTCFWGQLMPQNFLVCVRSLPFSYVFLHLRLKYVFYYCYYSGIERTLHHFLRPWRCSKSEDGTVKEPQLCE